jgi:hypothetical protein
VKSLRGTPGFLLGWLCFELKTAVPLGLCQKRGKWLKRPTAVSKYR